MVVQVLSRIVYAMYLINIILQATIYNNNVQLKRNSFAFVGKRIRTQRLFPLDAIRSRAANQRRILLERKSLNRPWYVRKGWKGKQGESCHILRSTVEISQACKDIRRFKRRMSYIKRLNSLYLWIVIS